MTQQLCLLDLAEPPKKTPRRVGPQIVTTVDEQRLSGQCARILALLRIAPQLNSTIATVSLKYTSRISDLRAAGYTIKCERVADGLTRYHLVGEPERGAA
jgi:hypothetical protein